MITYGSVCSGIEAATVAWHPLGWKPAWFAEIDKFPSAVLAHHYPEVPNLGDFTKIGSEHGPVDLLVGGTPCQDYSVAGKRAGMAGSRGALSREFIRLLERLRPRWVVWENVPGVFSTNGGRDFGAFIRDLAECGYGFAYRVLDAQHFGVAQRRRRVFVVGYSGDWRPAAAVLFESESLRRDLTPRRRAGERTAGSLSARPSAGGGLGTDFECDGGLIAKTVCAHTGIHENGQTLVRLLAGTLDRGIPGRGAGNAAGYADHLIPDVAYACGSRGAKGPNSDANQCTLIAHALRAEGFDASKDGTGRGTPLVPTFGFRHSASIADSNPVLDDCSLPLRKTDDCGPAVLSASAVRRLTPRECERLQGFPDDYTLIPYRNKPAADGPRYRALGNSMAVPCMYWIGERIQMVEGIANANQT